jgi:hypothetical protein
MIGNWVNRSIRKSERGPPWGTRATGFKWRSLVATAKWQQGRNAFVASVIADCEAQNDYSGMPPFVRAARNIHPMFSKMGC